MKKILLILVVISMLAIGCKKQVYEPQKVIVVTVVDTIYLNEPFCGVIEFVSVNGNYAYFDVKNNISGNVKTFSDYNPNFETNWNKGDTFCSDKMW